MATVWSRAGCAVLLSLLASCAPQPSAQERINASETAALAPLKKQYPAIVTAFDLSGTRLDIAIDANGYISTGDDDVDRFKRLASRDWRAAWSAAHPHQHALLTVRLVDFMGRTWATERVKA
ncbi:MAG TPA: hypothetical protein VMA98_11600 [Candidatus Acidoferrales bacterium]|nr:hypothetical protein [Candidatus Acidoferrales bacterium]